MKRNKIYNSMWLVAIMAFLMVAPSCSETELDQEVPHLSSPDNLFKDKAGFEAGLYGIYGLTRVERSGVNVKKKLVGSYNALAVGCMMGGTDVITSSYPRSESQFIVFWQDQLNAENGYLNTIWEWQYKIINAANTIINRAENGTHNLTDEEKNYYVAEARFFRAWAYRHLTYLFGAVPINTEESDGSKIVTDWKRNSLDEVYAFMEKDLKAAVDNLTETPMNDARVSKGTAQHYLTELYICMEQYNDAITVGSDLIDNGAFRLVTERYGKYASEPGVAYMDMFKDGNSNYSEGNTEALWVMPNQLDINGGKGRNIMRREFISDYNKHTGGGLAYSVERGGRGQDRLCATNYMLNDVYDKDANGKVKDDRGSDHAWRKYHVINAADALSKIQAKYPDAAVGDTLWMTTDDDLTVHQMFRVCTRKWDWTRADNVKEALGYNDHVYLRLADTYLLMAEAYQKAGDNGKAAEYINALRNRAHAAPITAADVTVDFIMEERARELYSEEHRRYTLLRNNKWLERTQLYNSLAGTKVTDRDKLYPIPQPFIDANLDNPIENNPGY
ncbi:RagB/SusD family nutrient uptake outer membrane protein [Prolixibacteraceae bacterium JC049]|nr:RagB/SusD family nutrient uptake outer membrane protein [Prolixibacteraceae bacterium JC049]